MSLLIRPPNTNALIGTPAGFSQSGSMHGHCEAGAVKRELGCAAGRPQPGIQSLPVQSSIMHSSTYRGVRPKMLVSFSAPGLSKTFFFSFLLSPGM